MNSSPQPSSTRARADAIKQEGNKFYGRGKYSAAADKYTEAIVMCPRVAIYYSNRSLCFKQRKMWDETLRDAVKALELDSNLYKAHMLRGEALCNLKQWEGGIKSLRRAVSVANRLKAASRVVDSLQAVLERNLKIEDEHKTAEEEVQDAQMLAFLTDAAEAHIMQQVNAAAMRMTAAGKSQVEIDAEAARIRADAKQHLARFQSVVQKQHEQRVPSEAPEWLCGPISFELYRDPVVTPSGHVYERRCVMEHLGRNPTDPLTRQPLQASQLYPCHPLRHAAKDFLDKNPWATHHSTD